MQASVFFMLFVLYTPLSSNVVSLFLKNSFPPSLGSMILKTASRENHARKSVPALPSHGLHPFGGLFIAPGICKIAGKNVYFLFMDPLWKLCLPFCVLPHAFCTTFSYFRNFVIILLKNGSCSRNSHRTHMEGSHYLRDMSYLHVAMMSSCWNRRL